LTGGSAKPAIFTNSERWQSEAGMKGWTRGMGKRKGVINQRLKNNIVFIEVIAIIE
jgi:ribosomal protein L19E